MVSIYMILAFATCFVPVRLVLRGQIIRSKLWLLDFCISFICLSFIILVATETRGIQDEGSKAILLLTVVWVSFEGLLCVLGAPRLWQFLKNHFRRR
jgi:hypothetical protein